METETIQLSDYPCLQQIAWQRPVDARINRHVALALYERNWRFVDQTGMGKPERNLLDDLVKNEGKGVFVV